MKIIVVDKKSNKVRLNKLLGWLIYLAGYTCSFLLVSLLFDTFQLTETYTVLWALLAVAILYFLNNTIRPIIFAITIPLTGLTLGIFYFIINMGILKLVDIILGSKLDFTNGWTLFCISILLSLTNAVIELLIIKPIIKRVKHHE